MSGPLQWQVVAPALEGRPDVPAPVAPYSHATAFGPLLFVTGQMPVDPASNRLVGDGIVDQTHQVMQNLIAVVSACGAKLEDTLMARCYLTSMELFDQFNAVYASYFPHRLPSRTCVAVEGLAVGALVEVDLIVARSTSTADGFDHLTP